jgi:ubiquinone/menaquinone biosynthesis C-methylase UbiE
MRRFTFLALALASAACTRDRAAETTPPPAVASTPMAAKHPHASHEMHKRFENAQEWSRVFDAPDRDAWQKPDAVVAKLKLKRGSIVADIGAGTGYFTVRLAKAVPNGTVFAVDVEPDMVAHIEERAREAGLANVVASQSRPDNPGLGDPVDVAFLCDVVHHIEDRPAFFAKLAERLRPGGRIVIVDFSPDAPDDGPGPPKEHRLSIQTLDVELGAAELDRTATDVDLLPYQYVVEYRPRRR